MSLDIAGYFEYLAIMTHATLLNFWTRHSDLAADLRIKYEAAKQMRRRGVVAGEHWPLFIKSGRERHGQPFVDALEQLVEAQAAFTPAPAQPADQQAMA